MGVTFLGVSLIDFLLGFFVGGGVFSLVYRFFLGQEEEYYGYGVNAGIVRIIQDLLSKEKLVVKVYEDIDGREIEIENEGADIILERVNEGKDIIPEEDI